LNIIVHGECFECEKGRKHRSKMNTITFEMFGRFMERTLLGKTRIETYQERFYEIIDYREIWNQMRGWVLLGNDYDV